MAIITPAQKAIIQKNTIVYEPIYTNNMEPIEKKGSYVLFYIFSDRPEKFNVKVTDRECVVTKLNKFARTVKFKEHTFIKIGNFTSGSKGRHATNKGDLIQNDGNRSPAARHSQEVLLAFPDLYLHFIMVVLTNNINEAILEAALLKNIKNPPIVINNKAEKIKTPPGKWNQPIKLLTNKVTILPELAKAIK
jgi:ribosomal protein S19